MSPSSSDKEHDSSNSEEKEFLHVECFGSDSPSEVQQHLWSQAPHDSMIRSTRSNPFARLDDSAEQRFQNKKERRPEGRLSNQFVIKPVNARIAGVSP
jgi:hypothetical protein